MSRPPIGNDRLPEPTITPLDGGNFRVERDVHALDARHGCVVVVPRGFVTDLSSSPRAVWAAFDRLDGGVLAPCVHDLLYRTGGDPAGCVEPRRRYARAEADTLFRDLMRRQGVPLHRAWRGWLGVRLFGWLAWRSDGAKVQALLDRSR
jgi:hypothetical protein